MAESAPTYDLVLLLAPGAEEERRSAVLSEVESAIGNGGGEISRRDDWGRRPLAYRIEHQAEADYHLIQFTGPPSLLESLTHSLHIADGVLRFRIVKLIPGTPAAPDSAPPVVATAAGPGGGAPSERE